MTIKIEKLVPDHPAGGLPPHPHEYPLVGALPACWPIRSGSVPG